MLSVYEKLFAALSQAEVGWAVWKSLENLQKAVAGDDDLDVLVKEADRSIVLQVLAEVGFVYDPASPGSVGREIAVFWAVDPKTLKTAMAHIHFQCRFGSKKYKEYRLARESDMLERAIDEGLVRRVGHGDFLVTRVLQATVKRAFDDEYLSLLCAGYPNLTTSEQAVVAENLTPCFGEDYESVLGKVGQGDRLFLEQYQKVVHDYLDKESSVEGNISCAGEKPKSAYARHSVFSHRFLRNKLGWPVDVVIAGHDGAGKTTVTNLLMKSFSHLSRCRRVYLGRNRWSPLNKIINAMRSRRFCSWLRWVWPVTSTLELLGRIAYGKILKFFGFIVFYDRSILDLKLKYEGEPLSEAWFPLLVTRLLNGRESDLCFLLVAEPDVAFSRKRNQSKEHLSALRDAYMDVCGASYQFIDTSSSSALEVAGGIAWKIVILCGEKAQWN